MMGKILTAELSEHHITKPEVGNPRHNKKSVLLFLVIATTTTTLSVPTIIMINAQESSSSSDNRGDSGTDKQMGICVIGVRSPCNGDSNSAK
jgi:spore maturation protein SpmA